MRVLKHLIRPWRDRYLGNRTHEELCKDAVEAFDQIGWLKVQVRLLTGVVLAEGALIKWLADKLFSCIDQAHQVARMLH
ncbi:MAG: hypothetical protein JWO19_4405 [Bryobacterales bacterium]|nr:hypothetical protein [Bryobacterales bacterium]